jgi:MoaA/NifB/PqqE/SkfB family radical SAM enzyme
MINRIDLDVIVKFMRCVFKRPKKYPDRIQVDVNTGCNLKCKMCPAQALGIKPEYMNIETAQRVALSFPHARKFFLTGLGEPLLNPYFVEIVSIFRKFNKNAILSTTTNGYYLSVDYFEKLISAGINKITISLESVDLESSGSWGHATDKAVLENIKNISKLEHNIELIIQTALTGELNGNFKGILNFVYDCKLDYVNLVRLNNLWSNLITDRSAGKINIPRLSLEKERALVSSIKKYANRKGIKVNFLNYNSFIENIAMQIATHFGRYCIRLDSDLFVSVNGQAAVCCVLPDHYLGLIDGAESVDLAWKSEKINTFRANKSMVCSECDLVKV